MARKKYATMAKDYELKGYGALKAGEKYEIVRANKRYTYLQIRKGLEAQVVNSALVGYKAKEKSAAKRKTTGDAELDHLFGIA